MDADPDIILMNPSYNAKPIGIPAAYKKTWTAKAKDGKEDPTKGFVFVHFLSDVINELNEMKEKENKKDKPPKQVKLAVLLPVSAAIGTSSIIKEEKIAMLENNTLEAVFTLPDEIFYPGASACACCMLFTLRKPHSEDKETFFGYCKDDGFKKKKNLGRVEQFIDDNISLWKEIEKEWLYLFKNHKAEPGKSATVVVDGKSEWLCEAYMKTDFSTLSEVDYLHSVNSYLTHLIKSENYISVYKILDSKHKSKHDQHALSIETTKPFKVGKILFILNGKGITTEEIEENPGHFIAVQSGEADNGILGHINLSYCKEMSYTISERACLTVARSGSAGFVSFQPNGCVVGDSAKILLLPEKSASIGTYLFIQTLLTANRFKYAYGRKVTEDKYANDEIELPILVLDSGEPVIDNTNEFSDEGYIPDWQFMEDYIKSLPYGDRI